MHRLFHSTKECMLGKSTSTHTCKHLFHHKFCTGAQPSWTSSELVQLCNVVTNGIGGLDDLEANLGRLDFSLTSSVVSHVIDSCKNSAPTRRLLRFFSWSLRSLRCNLEDSDFNHVIRVFSKKADFMAIDILLSDFQKDGRVMESRTYGVVAEALVKLGREDEALGIFKNLERYKCEQDKETVSAVVGALCAKGHAKRAEGVVWHHKDKISGIMTSIYKSLLHGWTVQENIKEARRILKEMKSAGLVPDLFCYNTFLRCLCKQNLKSNPSGLVPESLNLMMEMRSLRIDPTSISYNILLSCLGKVRRVKESLQILTLMQRSGCSPDWVSYYLVVRVLYLSGRFGKGNQIVDTMLEDGLVPENKFYYDLIGVLCGVERVNHAVELFKKMKAGSLGGYGPVYDVLIPKLCRGGDFKKGRELWDEAKGMGIDLQCSEDILDPSVTEVFKPIKRKDEDQPIKCNVKRLEEAKEVKCSVRRRQQPGTPGTTPEKKRKKRKQRRKSGVKQNVDR